MYIRSIALCSLLTLTAQAIPSNEEINKSQIFKDKYLSEQRLNKVELSKETGNIDYKISNIKNMTTVSKDTNATVSDMIKKQLDKNTMQNKAIEIRDHKNSKAFQREVLEKEEYILYDEKINWQQHLGKYKKSSNKIIKNLKEKGTISSETTTNQYLNSDEKIYIIISSSMPNHIIKNYFEMLQNVNTDVTFVLRGTIGGIKKIMPTLNWIKDLLKKENGNYEYKIIIEPRVVTKYNIVKVPAVLYIKNFDSSYIRENSDEESYIYYGTVDVDYALEKINIDVNSEGLKKLLKSI